MRPYAIFVDLGSPCNYRLSYGRFLPERPILHRWSRDRLSCSAIGWLTGLGLISGRSLRLPSTAGESPDAVRIADGTKCDYEYLPHYRGKCPPRRSPSALPKTTIRNGARKTSNPTRHLATDVQRPSFGCR
jgi:hypothetical protein